MSNGKVRITRESMRHAIFEMGWTSGKRLIDLLPYDNDGNFDVPIFSGERKEDAALFVGFSKGDGSDVVIISHRGMCRGFPPGSYVIKRPNGAY